MFRISVLIPFLFPCCRMGKPQWRLCIHGRMMPRNYSVTLVRLDMTRRTKNRLVKTGSQYEIEALQRLEQIMMLPNCHIKRLINVRLMALGT